MYDYQTERPALFTDEGQRAFLAIRDKTHQLLELAGACRVQEIMPAGSSSSFRTFLACIDRMVELGEIREITSPKIVWGQYRVFVSNKGKA